MRMGSDPLLCILFPLAHLPYLEEILIDSVHAHSMFPCYKKLILSHIRMATAFIYTTSFTFKIDLPVHEHIFATQSWYKPVLLR